MTDTLPDLEHTPLILPPEARLMAVRDLAPRLRATLGPEADQAAKVLTRPGFRVTARLLPPALAALLDEFRTASLLTDAIARFSRSGGHDPLEVLDLSYPALADLVDGRLLVPAGAAGTATAEPCLGAGQAFAGFEIEALLRALDDTEVYRARGPDGAPAALKLARDGRAAAALATEAALLARLGGGDTPALVAQGREGDRAWFAMEWRDGMPVSVAAQRLRAAGDRAGLARLVGRLLDAYARLHARGVLHGDVHTGNALATADGRVSLIDFGQARPTDAGGIDLRRAGLPQFHDPQLAAALLAGRPAPAATPAGEQYAVAVLAYLLLTGLPPIRPAADRMALLARIAERPPLPFTARAVPAWPRVEAVLRRALATAPQRRFADMAAFARAFRAAAAAPRRNGASAATAVIDALRHGDVPQDATPQQAAWLTLRAALLTDDVALLALADLRAAQAPPAPLTAAIAAEVARARSDAAEETAAMRAFLAAKPAPSAAAVLMAARMLDGAALRGVDDAPLRDWTAAAVTGDGMLHAALALAEAGAVPLPADLDRRLDGIGPGSVWLWAVAHDLSAKPPCLARAIATPRPADRLGRGLALLRLYQVTGHGRWLAAARRVAAPMPIDRLDGALLALECAASWRALPPPWLVAQQA